jgi:hypothetical protein
MLPAASGRLLVTAPAALARIVAAVSAVEIVDERVRSCKEFNDLGIVGES